MKNILLLINDPKNAVPISHFALQVAIKTKSNLTLGHVIKKSTLAHMTAFDAALIDQKDDELLTLTDQLKKSLPSGKDKSENTFINCRIEETNFSEFSARMVVEKGVDLIVIGPQKKSGIEHFLFGTAVDAILDSANCALLIVPEHIKFNGFGNITFAADLSFNYQSALKYIADLAESFNGKITVNNVSNTSFPEKVAELDISKTVNEQLGTGYPAIEYHTLRGKNVKTTLKMMLEDKEVDLLCLVHRKYDFLQGLFHSSISKQMASSASLPILILPYKQLPDEIKMSETELEQFCFNTAEDR